MEGFCCHLKKSTGEVLLMSGFSWSLSRSKQWSSQFPEMLKELLAIIFVHCSGDISQTFFGGSVSLGAGVGGVGGLLVLKFHTG